MHFLGASGEEGGSIPVRLLLGLVSGRSKLMGKQDAGSLPEALDMRAEIQVVVNY